MKEIPLSQGQVAIVDDEDYERVAQFKWSAARITTKSGIRFYAHRTEWTKHRFHRLQKKIMLHRFVMNAPHGVFIDHRNRNSLDCRKENLRFATQAQNILNRLHANPLGFRGVWRLGPRKFTASVQYQNKRYRLGIFSQPEDAARAYDAKAKELHGEFAVLNFPDEQKVTDAQGVSSQECRFRIFQLAI